MNILKKLIILSSVLFLTSLPFSAQAKDCSDIKRLHKKLLCKAGSDRYSAEVEQNREKNKTVAKKEKKEFYPKSKEFNKNNDSLVDLIKNLKKKKINKNLKLLILN